MCARLLPVLVGACRRAACRDAGFASDPELLHVVTSDFDDVPIVQDPGNDLFAYKEIGDPTPVPAWGPDYNATAFPGPPLRGVALETTSVAVLRAQYEVFAWLQANARLFPAIAHGE